MRGNSRAQRFAHLLANSLRQSRVQSERRRCSVGRRLLQIFRRQHGVGSNRVKTAVGRVQAEGKRMADHVGVFLVDNACNDWCAIDRHQILTSNIQRRGEDVTQPRLYPMGDIRYVLLNDDFFNQMHNYKTAKLVSTVSSVVHVWIRNAFTLPKWKNVAIQGEKSCASTEATGKFTKGQKFCFYEDRAR